MNGLAAQFSDALTVETLNVATDGEAVYEALSLRGHPAIVIFLPDGTETYRSLGVQSEDTLTDAIEAALNSE